MSDNRQTPTPDQQAIETVISRMIEARQGKNVRVIALHRGDDVWDVSISEERGHDRIVGKDR